MQGLPGGVIGKDQREMAMGEKDKIRSALQAGTLYRDHAIVVTGKPVVIAFTISRPARDDPKRHFRDPTVFKEFFSRRKELFNRFMAVKQSKPAVTIVPLGQLASMV